MRHAWEVEEEGRDDLRASAPQLGDLRDAAALRAQSPAARMRAESRAAEQARAIARLEGAVAALQQENQKLLRKVRADANAVLALFARVC